MAVQTYQAYYQYEVKKLIEEEIQRLSEIVIADNGVVVDYATYRHHIGQIRGLRRAYELCDEAEAVINGKE
jgi:phosphopantetheine adenylyltransferase